ncbi:MAG TPA: hypothetical protein VJP88_01595 [Caulobacteraceae bacterium]|nr:hypothetical protein [Caulobacteraceae bacterium]
MAAFFNTPVSAGIVVCAERVLVPRRAQAAAPRLSACWIRNADGRLTRAWGEAPHLTIAG